MDTPTLMALLGFLTLGGNLIISIWNYRNEMTRIKISANSSDAKAASDLTQAWKPYVDELKEQVEKLEQTDKIRTQLLITAVTGLSALLRQLKARNIEPEWTMPPELSALVTEYHAR